MINHYATLELPNFSGIKEIKRNFRLLALKYHPDKCDLPNAAQLFIKINEAYRILSNSNSKSIFDRLLSDYLNKKREISPIYQNEYKKYQNEAYSFAFENSKLSYQKFKERIMDNMLLIYDSVIFIAKVLFYILLIVFMVWIVTW